MVNVNYQNMISSLFKKTNNESLLKKRRISLNELIDICNQYNLKIDEVLDYTIKE